MRDNTSERRMARRAAIYAEDNDARPGRSFLQTSWRVDQPSRRSGKQEKLS
jgi:hypothetical protein